MNGNSEFKPKDKAQRKTIASGWVDVTIIDIYPSRDTIAYYYNISPSKRFESWRGTFRTNPSEATA